jgi:1-acyl-sn-glycerol-3-phosphate acyltransferase
MKEGLLQKIVFWILVVIVLFPTLGIYFLLLRWIGRIKIIGEENLIEERHIIFAFNHPSMVEVVWVPVMLFFHYFPRSLINPSKYVPWSFPDIAITRTFFFLNWLRCISIKKGRKDLEALNKAIFVLRNGGNLAIAPEGGRTAKGIDFLPPTLRGAKIRVPRLGIGRIIKECNPKVVPVWVDIDNDVASLGITNWLSQTLRDTTIVIGRPMDFSSFRELPDEREIWEEISLRVAREILALSEKVPR